MNLLEILKKNRLMRNSEEVSTFEKTLEKISENPNNKEVLLFQGYHDH